MAGVSTVLYQSVISTYITRRVGDSPCDMLAGHPSPKHPERSEWQVHAVYETCDSAKPHLGCKLVQETVAEDHILLRAELLCATFMIAERARHRKYMEHKYIPVRIA